jgi:hypothetical protein
MFRPHSIDYQQPLAMSDVVASTETFASGRYSKRKRTQVTYYLDELDVSDSESDFDNLQAKVRRTFECIHSLY